MVWPGLEELAGVGHLQQPIERQHIVVVLLGALDLPVLWVLRQVVRHGRARVEEHLQAIATLIIISTQSAVLKARFCAQLCAEACRGVSELAGSQAFQTARG